MKKYLKDKQLLAFVLLSVVTGYNFFIERQHSNANREHLANDVTFVLRASCTRGNDLRTALQSILRDNEAQVRIAVKDKKINAADGRNDLRFLHKEEARIAPLNCKATFNLH